MTEIINSIGRGKLLHVDGYLYYKHSENKGRFYWCCRKEFRRRLCLKSYDRYKKKASEHPEALPA
jgi:hypothetical protein